MSAKQTHCAGTFLCSAPADRHGSKLHQQSTSELKNQIVLTTQKQKLVQLYETKLQIMKGLSKNEDYSNDTFISQAFSNSANNKRFIKNADYG
jgi:hypothetical protein